MNQQRRDPTAPIVVLDIASTGLPARHPSVGEQQSRGYLSKAATKLKSTGDLLHVAEDIFSCGWPDVTISFRRAGASASDIHSWTLRAPQPGCAVPGREDGYAG